MRHAPNPIRDLGTWSIFAEGRFVPTLPKLRSEMAVLGVAGMRVPAIAHSLISGSKFDQHPMRLVLSDEVPPQPWNVGRTAILVEKNRQPSSTTLLNRMTEVVGDKRDVVDELATAVEQFADPASRHSRCPQLNADAERIRILKSCPDHMNTISRAFTPGQLQCVLRRKNIENIAPISNRRLQIMHTHRNMINMNSRHSFTPQTVQHQSNMTRLVHFDGDDSNRTRRVSPPSAKVPSPEPAFEGGPRRGIHQFDPQPVGRTVVGESGGLLT